MLGVHGLRDVDREAEEDGQADGQTPGRLTRVGSLLWGLAPRWWGQGCLSTAVNSKPKHTQHYFLQTGRVSAHIVPV